jgi:hypothetical protein
MVQGAHTGGTGRPDERACSSTAGPAPADAAAAPAVGSGTAALPATGGAEPPHAPCGGAAAAHGPGRGPGHGGPRGGDRPRHRGPPAGPRGRARRSAAAEAADATYFDSYGYIDIHRTMLADKARAPRRSPLPGSARGQGRRRSMRHAVLRLPMRGHEGCGCPSVASRVRPAGRRLARCAQTRFGARRPVARPA